MPAAAGRAASSTALLVAVFGILTAVDSLCVDMYLPSFSAVEESFGLNASAMSLSLSIFLVGLAVGQGICAPLADRFGRRPPLIGGMALFTLASLLAAVSPDFETLLAARLLQGLGAAAGLVMPRTITADMFDEKRAAPIFTALVQVQSVSYVLAPVLGAAILELSGWRGIFWTLTAFGIIGAASSVRFIPETRPRLSTLAQSNSLASLKQLLCNGRYLWLTISFGALNATFFTILGSANFIYVTNFGATPAEFSLFFAANAAGFILFGFLGLKMMRAMAVNRVIAASFASHLASAVMLAAVDATGIEAAAVYWVLLFFVVATTGIGFGALASQAMYAVPAALNSFASSALGVLQYLFSALSGALVGLLSPQSLMPIWLILLGFSLLSAASWARGITIAKPEELRGQPRNDC